MHERVGRVRVVDQHRERLAGVDPLEPARHGRHIAQPPSDDAEGLAERACRGRGGECVPDVHRAEQRELGIVSLPRAPVDEHEPGAVRAVAHVFHAHVGGRLVARVRHHVEAQRARATRDLTTVIVVEVGDGHPAAVGDEQARLGLEIGGERAVVVEVVVREIGEARRREPRAVDPVLRERVRRHLHRDGANALVAHAGQQRLEIGGLGGRQPDGHDAVADAGAGGPDQAGPLPRRRRDRVQEVGGGGLAVGPRDADAPQRARWVALDARRHRAEDPAHVGDLGLHDAEAERALDEERHRARRDRGRGVGMAVGVVPGHAGEARAGPHAAAVVLEGTDVDGGIPREPERGDPVEEVEEQHARQAFHHGRGLRVPAAPGTRSTARACCMICENTGAATVPPKNCFPGSSSTTIAARRGLSTGAKPTNDETYR